MAKFYGGSYLRTDIDLMDRGAVQAAAYRYAETGNFDEMRAILNEPWAKTTVGQKAIEEIMDNAKKEVAKNKGKAKKSEEDRDRDNPTWWLSDCNQ